MLKIAFLTVAAVALAGGIAAPASAAKPMRSCYDFAWESQDQKDCLANPDKMKHMGKGHHKGMKHDMRDKDMKGMDHDKDMKKS